MSERSVDHRRLHDDENADFVEYLRSLDADDWDRPSLCEGWRVRDVVGHILYGNELNVLTLPWKLARHGFSSDRSGKVNSIARAEGRTPQQLVTDFAHRNPWAGTCRLFPPRLVLLDRLVHHQDIRRALGHHRTVPEERLLACLDAAPGLGSVFGAKRRVEGLHLQATDVEWAYGERRGSKPVRGPGEALLLAMLGRGQVIGDLSGRGVADFAARMRPAVTP